MKSFNILYILILCATLIDLSSCSGNKEKQAEEVAEEHSEEKQEDIVTISPLQFKAANIRLGSFEEKAIESLVKASGTLDVPPQNHAGVSSLISGKVTKINVIQGEKVKKGQVLAWIENPEIIQLQKEYLEAKSNFEYSRQEYLRQKELFEEKIVAGKKYQAAQADYRGQQALINSLENQLRQLGVSPSSLSSGNFSKTIPVVTPIGGNVNTIAVKTGAYIDASEEMFEVIDNDHVHVDLNVYEKDVPKVREGQKIFFTVRGSDSVHQAEIFSVAKSFNEKTRAVPVHAEIEKNQSENLLPGMYVDGRIQVGLETVTALPDKAIVKEAGKSFVFLKLDSLPDTGHLEENDEHATHKEEEIIFKRVQVMTGISELGYTQIIPLEKFSEKASVVIDGAFFLAGQMKNEAGGGGDAHGH